MAAEFRRLVDAFSAQQVQLPASALGCFSKPIPDYQPDCDFKLPQAKPGTASEPLKPEERLYR